MKSYSNIANQSDFFVNWKINCGTQRQSQLSSIVLRHMPFALVFRLPKAFLNFHDIPMLILVMKNSVPL